MDKSIVLKDMVIPENRSAELAQAIWTEDISKIVTPSSFGEFMVKKLMTVSKFLGLK